jgi:hypothetical protein
MKSKSFFSVRKNFFKARVRPVHHEPELKHDEAQIQLLVGRLIASLKTHTSSRPEHR